MPFKCNCFVLLNLEQKNVCIKNVSNSRRKHFAHDTCPIKNIVVQWKRKYHQSVSFGCLFFACQFVVMIFFSGGIDSDHTYACLYCLTQSFPQAIDEKPKRLGMLVSEQTESNCLRKKGNPRFWPHEQNIPAINQNICTILKLNREPTIHVFKIIWLIKLLTYSNLHQMKVIIQNITF